MNDTSPYTFEDYDFIYKNFNSTPIAEIAEKLGRSIASVRIKAEKLGLIKTGEFTATEQQYARTYGKTLGTALMFVIPDRTSSAIKELLQCTENTSR